MTIAALAMVAAIAAMSSAGAASRSFIYRCDDGTVVAARFAHRPDRVVLSLNGKTLTLPQQRSGSGARYATRDTTFWIKGQSASFERAGKATACRTR